MWLAGWPTKWICFLRARSLRSVFRTVLLRRSVCYDSLHVEWEDVFCVVRPRTKEVASSLCVRVRETFLVCERAKCQKKKKKNLPDQCIVINLMFLTQVHIRRARMIPCCSQSHRLINSNHIEYRMPATLCTGFWKSLNKLNK